MKKSKSQDQFFEELKKIPIIQVACEKTNLSRNTIYRWRKEDQEFSNKMDQAISDGVDFVNDMSESQLLTLIKEKSYSAISFWLRHRNPKFRERVEIEGTVKTIQELSLEQKELINNSLRLANLTLNKNEQPE